MPQTPPIHLLNGESSFGGFTKLDIGDALALALPVLVDLHALHLECTPSTGQDNFSFPTSPNVLKASLKSSSSTDFPQTMKSREFGGTLSFLLVSVIAVQPNDKRAQRFTFWYPIWGDLHRSEKYRTKIIIWTIMQIRGALLLQGDPQHGDATKLKTQNIKIEHEPLKEATWL